MPITLSRPLTRCPVSADFHSANQPPVSRSDLLVVNDAAAPPGTVSMFHHVCDRQPAALPLLTLHHELHGYEHFATLSACKGARGVNRNADEQSALLPPLLSRPAARLGTKRLHKRCRPEVLCGCPSVGRGRLSGAKIVRRVAVKLGIWLREGMMASTAGGALLARSDRAKDARSCSFAIR